MNVKRAVFVGLIFAFSVFSFFQFLGMDHGAGPASANNGSPAAAAPASESAVEPADDAAVPAAGAPAAVPDSANAIALISGGEPTDVPWTGNSPAAKRVRRIVPDPAWMTPDPVLEEGELITLALFDDAVFDAKISDVTRYPNGAVGVTAHLQGESGGTLYLSYSEQQLRVSVEALEDGDYYVRYCPETDEHVAIEVDRENSVMLQGAEILLPSPSELQAAGAAAPAASDPAGASETVAQENAPDGYTTLDVMVVYTPAALAVEGGVANMEANIALAVQRANEAHANSDTQIYLQLVHSEEVTYVESTTTYGYWDDLTNLTYTSNGCMDDVHTWRDTYGADFVCLFVDRTDVGGYGWVLSSTSGRASDAFCIASVRWSDTTYNVAHEWAHNMGCGHSATQAWDPSQGIYSYSHGWQWDDSQSSYDGYCSVMTYPDYDADGYADYTQVAHFSNPDISYTGNTVNATGDATAGDNARTMREMKDILAAYRATVADPDPDPEPSATTNYSYLVSFENGFDDWSYSDGDFSWVRHSGETPSNNTGPSSAADGSWYVYTESEGHDGQTAWLSKTFDFTSMSALELGFMYLMDGKDMGTLSVSVSTNNGVLWNPLWSVSGDKGVDWSQMVLSLDAYQGLPEVSVRFAGLVADDRTSDLALDLITITGVVTVAAVDMDGDLDDDGLPDDWETFYFSGTNADPFAPASNGVNTLLEAYIAGLDPTDPDALFVIGASNEMISAQDSSADEVNGLIDPPSLELPGVDGYVLSWTAVSGRVYSVWRSAGLQENFQPLTTNIFWPQSSYTDTVDQVESFYQVDVRLQ